jgi:hypothetical protein
MVVSIVSSILLLSLLTFAIDSVQQFKCCIVASLLLCCFESWGSCQSTNASSLDCDFCDKRRGDTKPTITMTTVHQSNGDLIAEHQTAPGIASPNASKRKRADSTKTQQAQSQPQAQLFKDLLELLNSSVASVSHHLYSITLTPMIDMIPHPRSCTCHCLTRRDSPRPTVIPPSAQSSTMMINIPLSLRACRTTSIQTLTTLNMTLTMLLIPSSSLSQPRIP